MKNDKLQAIVRMAKGGTKHEQENAKRILRGLCNKYDLVYEDVMSENQAFTYTFYRKLPQKLVLQIFAKVIGDNFKKQKLRGNNSTLYYECSKQQHIDFINACLEYSRVYRKEQALLRERHKEEKRLFFRAFINKHDIFPENSDDGKSWEDLTEGEIEDMKKSMKMAEEMDEEVNLHKQISA
jgi:hypothetical protein